MATERRVRFRDCSCPGTPHDGQDGADDGDYVTMRPALSFAAGAEALRMMAAALVVVAPTGGGPNGKEPIVDNSRADEMVGPVYVRHGVESWNVVDEDGPVPVDTDAILSDYSWSYPIAAAGDDLYSGAVLAPLLRRTNASSGSGPTAQSTRQPSRSSGKARSQRKPSSQPGTAGRLSVVNQ